MRILFGVVTATENPEAIAQLIAALGPRHQIVLHHDHRKRGPLCVTEPNVHLIEDPADTGWGTWGFCEAILKTISTGLSLGSFDYYQLLSGSCLPIKPITAFESHLATQNHDVNIALTELVPGTDAWYSHGYRLYHRLRSLPGRLMWRAGAMYGQPGRLVTMNGLTFRLRNPPQTLGLADRLKGAAAASLFRACASPRLKHTPFHDGLRPFVASTWFGCTADAARYLIREQVIREQGRGSPGRPSLEQHMRDLHLADETYFATRFGNSGFRLGPSNHMISPFDGPHPIPFDAQDLPALAASEAFFARKFPLQPDAPVRQGVLERVHADPRRQTNRPDAPVASSGA